MSYSTPEEVIQALFRGLNDGDADAIVVLYGPSAAMVAQPGQIATGTAGIREVMGGFLALNPTVTLEKSEAITAGDLSLVITRWTLEGTDSDGEPVHMEGTATDVMGKQADGSWLILIDNPWGGAILG